MTIRPAIVTDVPQVLPMVDSVCALHESWDPAKYHFRDKANEMYRRWLGDRATDARGVFLVAETTPNSQAPPVLVGFLVGTIEKEIPIYKIEEFGFIHDLWVEPSYRNEGIARQLVMLAIERFTILGVRQIRLDTAVVNEPARKLFSTCGFRPSTTEMLLEISAETSR